MADDRPVEDTVDQLARVTAELADLRSTVLARLTGRPTGTIEATLRTTAPAGTLLMQGQVVNRADYPALWQWAQDNSLVTTNLFTSGNGSTTFGLPDLRGRVIRAGFGHTGDFTGVDTLFLTTAQLPAHDHGGATASDSHSHSTSTNGGHSGHEAFPITVQAGSGATDVMVQDSTRGDHTHTVNSDSHSHTISSSGSGSAIDNRQAGIDVNWIIYT